MRSRNSITVTSAPSRRHTEPSSRPMMPAPTTTRRLGTSASSSAPVEETIFFSSTVTPGSGITSEPEAIRMFFAASVSLTAPSSPSDRDRARLLDAAGALERGDLVLAEQEGDALGRRFDHLALALHELGEVERRRRHLDAVHGEIVARLLEQVRGLQQRLGRDAADIEAGAAEGRALLDHRHLDAELGRRGSPRHSRRARRRSRPDRRFRLP